MSIVEVHSRIMNILLEPPIKVFPPKKNRNYVKRINSASLFGYDNQCWKTRKANHKAGHRYKLQKSKENHKHDRKKVRNIKLSRKEYREKKKKAW